MSKMKDMTGQKFGALTVIKYAGRSTNGLATWLCKCECGNEFVARGANLRSGATRSCGCLQKRMVRKAVTKHNMSKTLTYSTWHSIRSKCYYPGNISYRFYGGKGIKMCKRWDDFQNFYADMGPRPEGCALARKDTIGDFSPENCEWVDFHEQLKRGHGKYEKK